jgi:hypothetical protein
MNHDISENLKKWPVNCPDARKKYDGKKVAIPVMVEGKKKLYLGRFVVRQFSPKGPQYVSVHIEGRIFSDDPPPPCGWAFHLSQDHVDSIVPANDEKGEIEFLVQEAVGRQPHNRSNSRRQGQS